MTRVRITIEADAEFIAALNANVGLSQDRERGKTRQIEPKAQLALICLGEFRGALEEQIDQIIQPQWAGHIRAVHECREVEE